MGNWQIRLNQHETFIGHHYTFAGVAYDHAVAHSMYRKQVSHVKLAKNAIVDMALE